MRSAGSRPIAALFTLIAVTGLGAAIAACATKLGNADLAAGEGRPCGHDSDCPQPVDPCQVWTCWQGLCTPVAAARDTALPPEAQTRGDCKVLVCDGQGKATGLLDRADEPPEDDNPCALEVCQDGEPAFPPVAVGTACGKNGVCNGHGKCGGCLPEAQRCQGNKPEVCSEEGAWESDGPCAAATPICAGKACIGVPEIAAGDGFSCVRVGDGKVRCFGEADKLGQDGARRVAGLSGVIEVVSGGEHTCAVLSNRTVRCWGSNSVDQLGDATVGQRGTPAPVPKLEKVTQIAAGDQFTCARLEDGTAMCWGKNDVGQLGTGPIAPPRGPIVPAAMKSVVLSGAAQDRPTEVPGLSGAVGLALGIAHGCARLADGGVACWGSDQFGALGRGANSPPSKDKKTAKALIAVKGLRDVAEVAAGREHACARLQDGTVMCWGRNQYGQLGEGTTKVQAKPVKVKDLAGVTGLALGSAHSCARLQDGTVRCWGRGASGQLGEPTRTDHAEPVAVPKLSAVAGLVSGGQHVCAKLADRTFVCWGDNTHGELGSGSTGETPSPIVW